MMVGEKDQNLTARYDFLIINWDTVSFVQWYLTQKFVHLGATFVCPPSSSQNYVCLLHLTTTAVDPPGWRLAFCEAGASIWSTASFAFPTRI